MADRAAESARRVPAEGAGSLSEVDTDRLVTRAIESVLEQVPDADDAGAPQSGGTAQPWAETAAPPGRNKRPLEDILEEYAASVRGDPDARAGTPAGRHPSLAFFERFSVRPPRQGRRDQQERGRGSRRARDHRPGQEAGRPSGPESSTSASRGSDRRDDGQGSQRRRRRRRRARGTPQ